MVVFPNCVVQGKDPRHSLKRRILANCGIVTENGYFTDFELIFERKNNPTSLTIP